MYLNFVGYENDSIKLKENPLDSLASMKKAYPYMKDADSLALMSK